MSQKRRQSSDPRSVLGRRGERIAADYLERAGLVVIERNYRCRAGEIDLIAVDGETVVFVEVKLRRGGFDPLEAVDARKQVQIARAAFDFLLRRGLMSRPARFDVIAVSPLGPDEWDCRHIIDAFDTPIEY
jgi:putative endonuclease